MQIPEDIARINRTQFEHWCRSQTQVAPIGSWGDDPAAKVVLARVLGKYLMYLDLRDVSVAPHLALSGYWEMWVTQFLARVVQPGWVAYDVGANVGYFTLLLSDLVGKEGLVTAFEPQERVARLLELSLQINSPAIFNARLERLALSDRLGEAEFHLVPHLWGGSGLHQIPGEAPQGYAQPLQISHGLKHATQIVTVPTERLDAIQHETPDVIKIDAEGAEPQIWAGMSGWIERGARPRLLIEWCPSRYQDAAQFLDQLLAHYRARIVTSDGVLGETSRDFLLGMGYEELEMLWLEA